MKSNKVYAIITARGGSKELPRKNLKLLGDKPLIAYSIMAAIECVGISRCLVTTENPEIREVSLQWGAEVIDRPIELATDTALSQDAVRHVLETLRRENDLPEYFVLLQPTSPLRNAIHLQSCLDAFLKSNAACAISVTEAEHHPYKSFRLAGEALEPLFDISSLDANRQSLPKTYRQNGAMYIMRSKLFLEKRSFFAQPVMPFFMTHEDSVDIDNEFDLMIAGIIMKRRLHIRHE